MGTSDRYLRALAAALAFFTVAAANAATIPLRAWLNAAQVPLALGGTGLGTVSFDTVTKVLTWSVTYTGLSGPCTAAHFHGPASAGVDAFPIVGMTCLASPLTGSSAALTPTQEAQLLSGQWYINIHTAANSGGEIRGQVLPVRGDLSGDGQSDVLWRNGTTGENYLYPMNGITILGSEGYLRTVADQNWQMVGIGDFDGDGKVDVLWRNGSTGENYLYLMNGTTIVGEGYVRTVANQNWRVAGVGDFNGDGKADVLWRNSSTGENYLYPMNGTAILGSEGYLRTVADQNWQVAGVGDLNGDGKTDIVWRNGSTGENYVYPMDGTTILGTEGFIRTVADLNWQVLGVADFDGDGRSDILWRNVSSGENYVYPMAGLTILASEGYIRTVADQAWQVAALGDYDGDGRSDILWRNGATGENYIYPMAGLTILPGEGYVRTVALAQWQPIGQVPPGVLAAMGVRTTLNQLAATVNAQGANLARSHVIGYYDIGALVGGDDRQVDSGALASEIRGFTINGFNLNRVLRYDPVNSVVFLDGTLTRTDAGGTFTEAISESGGGEGFKRQADGSWKFWGDQQIARIEGKVEMRTTNFGPGQFQEGPLQKGILSVSAPQNTVSAVTITGGGIVGDTVVPFVGTSLEAVQADPLPAPVEEYYYDEFFGETNTAITEKSAFTVTVTPLGGGAAQVYQLLSNAPTAQFVTVTSPTGHSLTDANVGGQLNVQWTLPGFAIARVLLSGNVRTAPFPAPGTLCGLNEQELPISATTGTLDIPALCGGQGILQVVVDVVVEGVNGERTTYFNGFR